VLRPFVAVGWTIAGALWALDHSPDGRAHPYAWSSAADLRDPAGWLVWRLAYWQTEHHAVLADPLAHAWSDQAMRNQLPVAR
jgi:hypothetical protein